MSFERDEGRGRCVLAALAGAVGAAVLGTPPPATPRRREAGGREYWVAAVPVTWNVVPNGRNAIEGERFTRAQTVFRTVAYRQFTKDFAKQLPNQPGTRACRGRFSAPVSATRSSSTSGTSTR